MKQQNKGIESLLNKIKVMRKLNHPKILKLYEIHETANSVYFVVDIVTGEIIIKSERNTYHQSQCLGFLPAETLQRSSQSLLLALNHLHQFNIAHRDLKPENLLLKSDENNYDNILGDFGIVIL
ncbi:unnamed protein product [Paramecium sonneborni]|uniref:non-specific serine/threonine protein kinase n=1 Tax=Paramecium sonneborni TaxID=65129 RepID=A0A8S1RRK6_9CILI|nr:unnamed protein product [Paramecium sonneborni]